MWRVILNLMVALLLLGGGYLGWREARAPGNLPLQEIRFQGTTHTNLDKALEVAGIPKETNLLLIDPSAVRTRLLDSLPWVRAVDVRRLYPGALAITIDEKIPTCMGKDKDGRLYLLDEYGMIIKPLEIGDPLFWPVVIPLQSASAEDSAARVVSLINMLARHPWLKERVSDAVGIPGGRWVLNTRKGVRVLLPAETEPAVARLKTLQDTYQILDRHIRQVDLRIDNKAAVRPEV